ncbi:MAG TPA: hypothetical protein VGM51_16380 [Armatimonadota bacterium]|jgi:hypothetical protein
MKCIDCGKIVGNWPQWLEDSRVTVRCNRCSNASATPVNVPKDRSILAPLTDLAHKMDDLAEAA